MSLLIGIAVGLVIGWGANELWFRYSEWKLSRKLKNDLFGGKVHLFRKER